MTGGGMSGRAVTVRAMSYIIVCAGCQKLTQVTRADALTCSPACRVRAHRNGGAERVRAMAHSARVSPGLIVRCMAIKILRPDLVDLCRSGEIEADGAATQREMFKSFWALACKQADALHDADTGAVGIDHHADVGQHHHVLDDAQEGRYAGP